MSFVTFLILLMIAIGFYYEGLISETKSLYKTLSVCYAKQVADNESLCLLNQTHFYYIDGKIKKPKKKKYYNPRLNTDLYERSKCNIAACLKDEAGQKFLKSLFMSFFPDIFIAEDSASHLIASWKSKLKNPQKSMSSIDLYHLKPKELQDVEIYEKLLNHPLFEKLFFYDALSFKKPLCFRFAKMPLFEAAFGKELSGLILEKEQEHFEKSYKKLTIEEIQNLLKSLGYEEKIPYFFNLFSFKEPKKRTLHIETFHQQKNLRSTLIKKFQESFE